MVLVAVRRGASAAVSLLSARLGWEVRGEWALSYAAYAPFVDNAIPLGGADQDLAAVPAVLEGALGQAA